MRFKKRLRELLRTSLVLAEPSEFSIELSTALWWLEDKLLYFPKRQEKIYKEEKHMNDKEKLEALHSEVEETKRKYSLKLRKALFTT